LQVRIGGASSAHWRAVIEYCLQAAGTAPSGANLLNKILERPSHEKPFVLFVVGHPAKNALVSDITRKPLNEISSFVVRSEP
jgi:hypothetical protein